MSHDPVPPLPLVRASSGTEALLRLHPPVSESQGQWWCGASQVVRAKKRPGATKPPAYESAPGHLGIFCVALVAKTPLVLAIFTYDIPAVVGGLQRVAKNVRHIIIVRSRVGVGNVLSAEIPSSCIVKC